MTVQDTSTFQSLGVDLGGLQLSNPIMPASGCFGPQMASVVDTSGLGAVVTKTVFPDVRSGNPAHRLGETPGGMINAVGIPSPGLPGLRTTVLPDYCALGPPVIVSIGGLTVEEYVRMAAGLAELVASEYRFAAVAAVEVNLSCPNLEHGGLEMGSVPERVAEVVNRVGEQTDLPVFAKLTPNVTDIAALARAAEAAGAHGLTVANTFVGLVIDVHRRRPVLGNVTGGVSGPAMKPLALRAVHQASRAVEIPVIGCGGIATASDVLEFYLAGASAVQVGTANFTRPDTMNRILDELPKLLSELDVLHISDLKGAMDTPAAVDLGETKDPELDLPITEPGRPASPGEGNNRRAGRAPGWVEAQPIPSES
ncbi:dihydroorotate dehydrogenase [Ornithinimicrobium sp. W1665]|uniref:dihydroorotate dehydrogenase n=1 Tax=Ornithinimicrobium sp. W1665 TaxID=3416666 RepID=UPI003CEDFC3B